MATTEATPDEPPALLQAALAYAQGGLHVFPLHSIRLDSTCSCGHVDCSSPGKHPRTRNGLKDATDDPKQIDSWWRQWPGANIGVACGHGGLYVIDIDGPRGADSWRQLCTEHGGEPTTRTVRTGNGRHLWYLTDLELGNSASKLAPGIDTRGHGGYVVAPPSGHAAGTTYAFENPGSPLAQLPDWIAQTLTKPTTTPTPAINPSHDEHAGRRLQGAAQKVLIAREGERNQTLNWAAYTAGRLIGAGRLHHDHVTDVLTRAARGAGLAETETRNTIASGIDAGRTDPDHDTGPTATRGPTLTVTPDGTPTPVAIPIDGLLQAALTKIQNGATFVLDTDHTLRAIWGNEHEVAWARGEPLIITGPTGVGKTTVAHQIIERRIGVKTDQLLDLEVEPDDRPVLYLACDRPTQIRRAFARRFGEPHRGKLASRLLVHNGYLPAMVDTAPTLLAELADHLGAGTVVIDSLKDVATELEKGPNAIAINQALQHTIQAGAEVIVLHHQRKSQGDNKRPKAIDDLYGNTLIPSGAGSVLLIWGRPGDLAVELHHLKQPADQIGPLKLIHDHQAGVTRIDEGERIDLVALAHLQPDGLTAKAAAQQLYGDQSRSATERARRELDKAVDRRALTRREGQRGGPRSTPTVWFPIGRHPVLEDVRYETGA